MEAGWQESLSVHYHNLTSRCTFLGMIFIIFSGGRSVTAPVPGHHLTPVCQTLHGHCCLCDKDNKSFLSLKFTACRLVLEKLMSFAMLMVDLPSRTSIDDCRFLIKKKNGKEKVQNQNKTAAHPDRFFAPLSEVWLHSCHAFGAGQTQHFPVKLQQHNLSK